MHEASGVPVEARQALPVIWHAFGDSLVAAYLHGSAVSGGLRPDSDVDVLVVIDRPTTHAARAELLGELMKISGRPGGASRPLELIVFHRADLEASAYPARSEFIYGEWLREAFEAGEVPAPASDPEYTLLLAQARHEARSLIGRDPAELLPIVPETDIRRAIGDALPALISSLEGDERNVLLTLARMWRTLATGQFVPKDVAGEWAMSRLPAESAMLVAHAREAYLGVTRDDWRPRRQEARRVAGDLSARVVAML
ncbi:aminoglycoside adenylyltransferase family protein [Sinorhizobium sp. 7-81]|uniref:aminoglycoside adenylyltransferase family protein n=1 Tax=Sinorhizobium sp. 8-89 TaxID=3049089 RepID=UPI0024C30CD4|nr:aminoglycoside adenylyltransferase family protein [Sinorhizobium sp. 8-89]MDK1489823.1 aminoglycoside adenylyltransferase family protein [Sinorhizobium sp. 8-89]